MSIYRAKTAFQAASCSNANQPSSRKKPGINWAPLVGYDVFISYKRQESSAYAGSLERLLREKDIRCFLDDNDIPAGSLLTGTVRTALRRSKLLIVVVSPGSLHSKYVQDEIRTFRSHSQHIVPILLASSKPLLMKEQAGDSGSESVILKILQKEEIVWINERDSITGLDSASPEVAKSVAGFFGFRRANMRRRVILAVLFALISIAASVASFEAVIARRQRNIAFSRQLAAQADLLREQPSALETRILLAVESMRLVPGRENDQALRESLYLTRKPVFIAKHNDEITTFALSPNGLIATASGDIVRVFDGRTGTEVSHWIQQNKVVSLAFGQDGHVIATGSLDGVSHLIELSSGKNVGYVANREGNYIMALSRSSRWLAMGSKNGTVRVVELSTGREALHVAQAHYISVLVFSPDDRWIAAGSRDGVVQVFEIGGKKKASYRAHRGAVDAITFSPNSRWVASGSDDGTASVCESASGKRLPRPSPSGWRERVSSAGVEPFSILSVVRTVTFSPDNRFLATGNGDSTARVFDVATGKELLRLVHGSLVEAVAFSPDGRWIATGSLDFTVRIFETLGGKEVAYLTQGDAVHAVAFSADGRTVAAITDKALNVFNAFDGREIIRLPEQNLLTTAVFSPDGQWLAVKSYDGQHIEILDALRGAVVLRLPRKDVLAALTLQPLDLAKFKPSGKRLLYSGQDEPVSFSGDSKNVALGDDAGTRVFELGTGKELVRMPDNEVKAVSFSPDGRWVATANADGIARVLDVASGTIGFSFTLADGLSAMVFSPDSHLVATVSGDHNVYVFEVPNGKEAVHLRHQSAVEALAFSPDSGRLATGTSDGTVRVFRVPTGQEVVHLIGRARVAAIGFSPDGHWLATGGDDRTTHVFEAASGKEVARLAHQAPIVAVVFTPNSSFVASASYDYTVGVFEAATGHELSRINPDGRVKAMKFVEGGSILQTASSGRLESEEAVSTKSDFVSVQRHLLRPEDFIQESCSRLTRNLTQEQWRQYLGDEPYHRTCPRLP